MRPLVKYYNNNLVGIPLSERFRGYLPVVIDIETGGLDPALNSVLEIAAVVPKLNTEGQLEELTSWSYFVEPHPKTVTTEESIQIHNIDPFNDNRDFISEKAAILDFCDKLRNHAINANCKKVILVAHNAWFDLSFLKAACLRQNLDLKQLPFHSFTTIDTASLSAVFCGHTVLAESCKRTGIPFNHREAHGALYDAQVTARLFFEFANAWHQFGALDEPI